MSALAAASLATHIKASLPPSASPQLTTTTDAIAIACHAGMLAVGFRLLGLGQDHVLPVEHQSPSSNAASSNEHPPLPQDWNTATSSSRDFRYAHPQSAMQFLLRIGRLGAKTTITGLGMGDDKVASFDVRTADYVSEGALPASPTSPRPETDAEGSQAIQHIFLSASRLTDLGTELKIHIIQKLVPALQKEGYEDSAASSTASAATTSTPTSQNPPPNNPPPIHDPSLPPLAAPRVPATGPNPDFPPPGFEDEHGILRPPRGWRPGTGGGVPLGERDLYPPGLGPRDPLGGGLGPRPGFGPGGGGMHPTFDDPMFAGRGDPDDFGRQGHPGFDPQVPPGARFDPVGPGMGPPRGSGFGGGGFGGPGGRPPNPFGGFGDADFI